MSTDIREQLVSLRQRYFRKEKAILTHHGDCCIYRSEMAYGTAFCSCGLLHDLQTLDENYLAKIYPHYEQDLAKQDGPGTIITAEERKAALIDLITIFHAGPQEERPEGSPPCDGWDWYTIQSVFGSVFYRKMETLWTEKAEDRAAARTEWNECVRLANLRSNPNSEPS